MYMSATESISISELRLTKATPKGDGKARSNREMAEMFWVSVWTVSNYTSDISQMIREGRMWEDILDSVQEWLSTQNDLSIQVRRDGFSEPEDQVNTIWEEDIESFSSAWFWEDDNWDIHLPYKERDMDVVIEDEMIIPLQIIDNIFLDHTRMFKAAALSSAQLIQKYNLWQYSPTNPLKVLNLLRSRMALNSHCDIWSEHTKFKLRSSISEERYQALYEERKEQALENRYKPNYVEKDLATENRFLRKKIWECQSKLSNIEYWKWIVRDVTNIQRVSLDAPTPKNSDSFVTMMWDWHLDAHYDAVVQRVGRMVANIKASWRWHVTIFGMGDWFEVISPAEMHPDQNFDVDVRFLDPREKVRAVIGLMVDMLKELNDDWIRVDFKMMNGNHDRISKNNGEDRYRMWWWVVSEMLWYAVSWMNVSIENLANRVNAVVVWDVCYIVWHGETDLYKKSAEEIIAMYGKPARYYVLAMGHLHSLKFKDGKLVKASEDKKKDNYAEEWTHYSKIIVPALCDGAFYSEQVIAKSSAPGYIEIYPSTYEWVLAPSIHVKRV